jgi:hypothetical protein
MKQTLFFISLAVAGLSLMVSFYLAQQSLLALAALLPIVAMFFARQPLMAWLASCSLAGFVSLSVVAIILHLPLLPVVLASTAALASWDLALEIQSGLSLDGSSPNNLYESLHLKFLGSTVILGLLGAGISQWIHWQVPFVGLLVLVFVTLFCLGHVLNYSH